MGEQQVELIEQTVKHHSEDIKELRSDFKELNKEFDELKMKHTVTDSNVNQMFTLISNLEKQFSEFNKKWDNTRDEQLSRFNSGLVKLFFCLVLAMVLAIIGLK